MSNTGVEYSLSLKDLFTPKIKQATTATEKLNNSVGKIKSAFSGVAGVVGFGVGTAGIMSFGNAVLESLKNYEYFSASLRTLMNGDEKAAKALQSQLVTLAAKTPFSLSEVQDASKQLLAYGFNAGTLTKTISTLGDVASGLKIPFGDIAYLYGTLKTQGRAYTRDIMQFTSRGIPVIKELAKQFKTTEANVMKLVETGKVGFGDIEKAFQSMTGQGGQFFNMMSEQSKTVGGQISNLGDNWEQLKVKIGQSQTGIINSTIKWANDMISALNTGMQSSNTMDEIYAKYGIKGHSKSDVYGTYTRKILGMGMKEGSYGEIQDYVTNVQKMRVDNATNNMEAQQNILSLSRMISNLNKEGYTKNKTYISVLQHMIDKNKEKVGLFAKNGKTDTANTLTAASVGNTAKAGTSTDVVEARGHQNFNISIDKLVEKLEFNTTNLKESGNRIKEEVTKALISAVNDFQLMATK